MAGKHRRILIFCTNADELRRITAGFERSGFIAASALSMREMFSLLEGDIFDAVVISAAGTSAIAPELLREIRELSPDSELVLITDIPSRKEILDSMNSGCSHIIENRNEDIPKAVSALLERGRGNEPAGRSSLEIQLHPGLTRREKEILLEMIRGKANREIGDSLGIREKTVKNHLWKIYRKYRVENRTQLFSILISGCPCLRVLNRNASGEQTQRQTETSPRIR